jgi:hypothetical protein
VRPVTTSAAHEMREGERGWRVVGRGGQGWERNRWHVLSALAWAELKVSRAAPKGAGGWGVTNSLQQTELVIESHIGL